MVTRMAGRLTIAATAAIALLLFAAPGTAAAAPIVQDQSNGFLDFFDEVPGQSFTAEDPDIATFGFFIGDENAALGAFEITYDFYSGAGTGGALLASQTVDLPDDFFGWLDLDFSAIGLIVGEVYTVTAASTSGRGIFAFNQHTTLEGDPIAGRIDYPGGHYVLDGTERPQFDAQFRVLLQEVPEPAALVVFSTGLAGLAMLFGYHRRDAGRKRLMCRT